MTTPDTDPAVTALEEVAQAVHEITQAEDRLHHAATRARLAGAQITSIADTAGVTRQTVYRWTQEADGVADPQRIEVRAMLDRGLDILASYGNTTAARYVGGAGTIVGALAAWNTGVKTLPKDQVTQEDWTTIRQVSAVVGLAMRAKNATGDYPRTVRL